MDKYSSNICYDNPPSLKGLIRRLAEGGITLKLRLNGPRLGYLNTVLFEWRMFGVHSDIRSTTLYFVTRMDIVISSIFSRINQPVHKSPILNMLWHIEGGGTFHNNHMGASFWHCVIIYNKCFQKRNIITFIFHNLFFSYHRKDHFFGKMQYRNL